MINAKDNLLFSLIGSRGIFAKKRPGSSITACCAGYFFLLLFCLSFLPGLTYAQGDYTLRGTIVNEDNNALAGASVFLEPVKEGTATDEEGHFVFNKLSGGAYVIIISFIGYHPFVDTLQIRADKSYHAQLKGTTVSLREVVITHNYDEIRKKEESLNLEIVNDGFLKQNLGGSLMNSLERLPGVTTMDIGAGQSKPVIRGLGFNRVVVVENGIKHEAQQWGADHGLEIDQYAVDYIEVIKGPVAIMYGSDAIGGVIDLQKRKIPAKNTFGGTIDLTGKTNNGFLGTSISLNGRKDQFFADVRATILDYGDYRVPTDSIDIYSYRAPLHEHHLRNTAGNEKNLHASFGVLREKFQSRFYVSSVNVKSGFFANAHGLEPRNVDTELHDKSNRDINFPYQSVNHFKLINSSQYTWEKLKLDFDAGIQRNLRQERSQYVDHGYMPAVFPDTMAFDPTLERRFDKYIYSGNLKLSYHLNEKTQFNFGVNSEYQQNRIGGRGFIIPEYDQLTFGVFAFARHALSDQSMIQGGIRYDAGNINTSAYHDWFPSPVVEDGSTTWQHLQRSENINRRFSNISWSAGYTYHPGKWSYKINLGKSFRMPIAKELAANGVNYHRFSYEVGNTDLSPEVSYQLDAGVEYSSNRFAISATPFLNYFSNYIYLNPTSEHNRTYGAGNQVFYYTQSEVLRYGGELHAHYELLKSLQLGVIGEYVYSEQLSGEKKGFTLPFLPPASAILNLKYQRPRMIFLEDAYVSLDYRMTASQTHIVPPEEMTDGFQVVNFSLGGSVRVVNQKMNVSMQIQNLFNAKYFNHTSFYRLINVPEQGRNLIVNISIPFSG